MRAAYLCGMEFLVHQVDDLVLVARAIVNSAPQTVLFFGGMGAGKTTLIRAICAELGVKDPVSSPTFSLVNEYLAGNGQPVYHFDMYRINHEEEAVEMGWWDYLDADAICLIEWPEKIPNLLPENALVVHLAVQGKNRLIKLSPNHL